MNLLFGTDGIRGPVGSYPFTLETLPRIGQALSYWAQQKYTHAHILLAQDTRISCAWVKASLKSGLLSLPVTLYNAGVLPTPALFHLMQKSNIYTCGIMISASHNSYTDNGIKLIDAQAGKITAHDEQHISNLINYNTIEYTYDALGTEHFIEQPEALYADIIINYFQPQFLKNYTIVLDTAHGATYKVAPAIFSALGAHVITINNTPTGININQNCGALHLESLQKAVIKHKALIGFAFDGDGDRVIAVNKSGVIKDGDDILALLSHHPDYQNSRALVSTIMANQALEVYLKNNNKTLIRTAVGDKYVAENLSANNLLLGGEQSGHIILKNIVNTGDGILVALKILETLIYTQNWDFKTFNKFPQTLINMPVKIKKDLNQHPLNALIMQKAQELPNGRLLVRYSGTEPLLRIMVEDKDAQLAHTTAQSLVTLLQAHLT